MNISVVIATKDRPRLLLACLKSISRQSLLPREVIIVDASKKKFKPRSKIFNIVYIKTQIASSTFQRNLGAQKANGKIIQFFDDDTIVEKDYLKNIAGVFKDKEIGGAGGKIIWRRSAFASFEIFLKKILFINSKPGQKVTPLVVPNHAQLSEYSSPCFVSFLSSCACAFRNEVFKKYSFDENLSEYAFLEDVDFSYRVSKEFKLFFEPKAVVQHHVSRGGLSTEEYKKRATINRFYFFRKHFKPTLYNKTVFAFSFVSELLVGTKRMVFNKDVSYLRGVRDGIKIALRKQNSHKKEGIVALVKKNILIRYLIWQKIILWKIKKNLHLKEKIKIGKEIYTIPMDTIDSSYEAFTYQVSHEPYLLQYIKKSLKPGDIFIDVGAYHGIYSLIASSYVGNGGKVIAIEPVINNQAAMQKIISANESIRNIEIINLAAGNRNHYSIIKIPKNKDCSTLSLDNNYKKSIGRKIRIKKLDDILSKEIKIDFVKIDVEGYEIEVIDGMNRIIETNPKIIIAAELHYKQLDTKKLVKFSKLIEKNNLEIIYAAFEPPVTMSYLKSKKSWDKKLTNYTSFREDWDKYGRTKISTKNLQNIDESCAGSLHIILEKKGAKALI